MILRINDVNHGNHIQIMNNCCCKPFHCCYLCTMLTIDYGSKKAKDYFPNKSTFYPCDSPCYITTNLLISHYHTDHYNGLVHLKDKSICINTLYYPYIPEFHQRKKLQRMMLFLDKITLEASSGSPAKDLFDLVKMKCRNSTIQRKGLKQGDEILVGNRNFHVVWPPKKLNGDNRSTLEKKIDEIEKIINSNDKLKKTFDEFDRNPETVFCDKPMESIYEPYKKGNETNLCQDEKTKEDIKELSKRIHRITNSFSVCLYSEYDFLFLGDLEEKDIKNCMIYLKDKYRISIVKNFITPHHGTHWDDSLFDICAWHTISSIGTNKSMLKGYIENIEKYKRISFKGNYSTLQNGTLVFKM